MLMEIVDAKEEHDAMNSDVSNDFIQMDMPKAKLYESRVVMKVTGVLVYMLVEMNQKFM